MGETPMIACQVCGRRPGSLKGRECDCGLFPSQVCDHPDEDYALGELSLCSVCGRLRCPDCEHEMDCCFITEATVDSEAPDGWRESVELAGGQFVPVYVRHDDDAHFWKA